MIPNFMKTGVNIDWEDYSLTKPMTVPVSSSAISLVSYNPITLTMEISFTDGTQYEYYDVEPFVFTALIQSSSVGRYFNYNVRNNYSYSEI